MRVLVLTRRRFRVEAAAAVSVTGLVQAPTSAALGSTITLSAVGQDQDPTGDDMGGSESLGVSAANAAKQAIAIAASAILTISSGLQAPTGAALELLWPPSPRGELQPPTSDDPTSTAGLNVTGTAAERGTDLDATHGLQVGGATPEDTSGPGDGTDGLTVGGSLPGDSGADLSSSVVAGVFVTGDLQPPTSNNPGSSVTLALSGSQFESGVSLPSDSILTTAAGLPVPSDDDLLAVVTMALGGVISGPTSSDPPSSIAVIGEIDGLLPPPTGEDTGGTSTLNVGGNSPSSTDEDTGDVLTMSVGGFLPGPTSKDLSSLVAIPGEVDGLLPSPTSTDTTGTSTLNLFGETPERASTLPGGLGQIIIGGSPPESSSDLPVVTQLIIIAGLPAPTSSDLPLLIADVSGETRPPTGDNPLGVLTLSVGGNVPPPTSGDVQNTTNTLAPAGGVFTADALALAWTVDSAPLEWTVDVASPQYTVESAPFK